MTWVESLPAFVGLLYLAAAGGYWQEGMRGLSLAYLAYAAANVGLIWAAAEARR